MLLYELSASCTVLLLLLLLPLPLPLLPHSGARPGSRHAPTELPAAEIRALLADRAPLMDMQVGPGFRGWLGSGFRDWLGSGFSRSGCGLVWPVQL